MTERGILFTPDNIRAIREGRKTQTRRVCESFGENMHYGKKLCEWDLSSAPFLITEEDLPVWHWRGNKPAEIGDWAQEIQTDVDDNCTYHITNRHGGIGDRLYVKEGVIIHKDEGWTKITGKKAGDLIGYYMDGARVKNVWEKRLTAMFMAKRYARTWLEITDVRVERVQDISANDALAEGIGKTDYWKPKEVDGKQFEEKWWDDYEFWQRYPQIAYQKLWDSINGKKHPWNSNPFVWCLSFKMVTP